MEDLDRMNYRYKVVDSDLKFASMSANKKVPDICDVSPENSPKADLTPQKSFIQSRNSKIQSEEGELDSVKNTEEELDDLIERKSISMINVANFITPKKSSQYF